jgi:hypothetical protein
MDRELRKQKLLEIINNDTPYMTGIRIRYKGENKEFKAYKIPHEYLIFNKNNGRIGSLVKSFEKQKYSLNSENENDESVLCDFLLQSQEDRNEATEKSLARDGQKQYGIVTNEGIIIDGNRRAMLLKRIFRNREKWAKTCNVDHAAFFIGVILPDGADPKEISRLETTYQMGEDEKLDYNPIEKYLKCKDLQDIYKFEPKDIAEMMGEKKAKIDEWLSIMKLMDEYLNYLDYSGIYTRLEKREGQFVDLNRYLSQYKEQTNKVDWNYSDLDISDLKSVCFDYIRAQYEGKEFRVIAQPNKKDSLFCKEEVWKKFFTGYKETIEVVNENEKPVHQWQEENKEADLTKLLAARDDEWKKQVENSLKENIGRASRENELINIANEPTKLINDALLALEKINTDNKAFYCDEVNSLLKKVSSLTWDYQKMIKHHKE